MKTDTLKKSLLDYAIKGKLTARFRRENNGLNAFDEISTYNDKIKEKRKDLEKELKKCEKELKLEKDKDKKALFKSQIQMLKKEIAKCKEITPLNLSEAPFTIPNSWAWVKLGDICEFQTGYTPKNLELDFVGEIPYFKVADMNKDFNSKFMQETELYLKSNNVKIYEKNSIIFPKNGGAIATNKKRILKQDSVVDLNTGVITANKAIRVDFLFYFMESVDLWKFKKGTAVPTIDSQSLTNLSIPLPPLKEQQEIVKKLDLLVTLANDFAITKENLKRIEKRI